MKNKVKRIAICGAGRISKRHFEALSQLGAGYQIVGIAEVDPIRLHQVSDLLPMVTKYTSVHEMMRAEEELDLVVVLVDSGRHFEVVMELLEFGVPTLVEKPLALKTQHAAEMVRKYEDNDTPLFVVKQNRLNWAVRELERHLKKGLLGSVNLVIANVLWCRTPEYYRLDSWRMSKQSDGGVMWNQASHYVDLVQRFIGQVEEVFAYGANFLSPANSEDTVIANLRGSSGNLANIVATTTVRPSNFEGSITVIGEEGLMRVGGHALNTLERFSNGSWERESPTQSLTTDNVYGVSHSLVYASVFRHLQGQEPSQFAARNTLHGIEVMEAIDFSINSGRPVLVDSAFEA